jgi:hypothetical protein
VLAKAINAIIAVIFFDCGEDIGVVLKTMRHLGSVRSILLETMYSCRTMFRIFTLDNQSVNPTLLCLDELSNSLDMGSLARSLFRTGTDSDLSLVANSDNRIALRCSSAMQRPDTHFQQGAAGTDVSGVVEHASQLSRSQLSPIQGNQFFEDVETNEEIAANQTLDRSMQIISFTVADEEGQPSYDIIDIERQPRRTTEKRVGEHQFVSSRKKKLRTCDPFPYANVLGRYLVEEEQKCHAFGQQTPQNTFLSPPIQHDLQGLGEDKLEVLAKILIEIGSPCLVGGLQHMLEPCRTLENCLVPEATRALSRMERIHLIANLSHTMSHSQMLRRFHILQLFKDCGGPSTASWEVRMTPADMTHPSNKRGNPFNRSVADVTARMMRESFPNVEVSTREYRTKYRWISHIRKFGQRLHMLETRFGEGFLGLMLDQGYAGTDVGITDQM